MSARTLANLMNKAKSTLECHVTVDYVKLCLDSKKALFWIYNQEEWKVF